MFSITLSLSWSSSFMHSWFREIRNALARIQNEKAYTVLYKYYLDCLTWDRVAKDMHYSLRMVYVLRRKAMEELSL